MTSNKRQIQIIKTLLFEKQQHEKFTNKANGGGLITFRQHNSDAHHNK